MRATSYFDYCPRGDRRTSFPSSEGDPCPFFRGRPSFFFPSFFFFSVRQGGVRVFFLPLCHAENLDPALFARGVFLPPGPGHGHRCSLFFDDSSLRPFSSLGVRAGEKARTTGNTLLSFLAGCLSLPSELRGGVCSVDVPFPFGARGGSVHRFPFSLSPFCVVVRLLFHRGSTAGGKK